MENIIEEWMDNLRDSEHTGMFFGLLFGSAIAGIGVDYLLHLIVGGSYLKGFPTIMLMLGSLGVIGLINAKERKEEEEWKAYARQSEIDEAKANEENAVNEALRLRNELTKLNKALEDEQMKVQGLTTAQKELTTAQAEFATAKESLATAQAELTTAKEKYATVGNELATAKRSLATATATAESLQEDKKRLLNEQSELAPYFQFFEDYKAYKEAESVKNNRKTSEEERAEASAKFKKAKAKMDDFFQERGEAI